MALETENKISTLKKTRRKQHEDEEIRKSIGIVFQDGLLDDLLTIEENMKVRAALYGLKGKELQKAINDIMNTMHIEKYAHRLYGTLSGGQKRKCDIARAFIHQPQILFLDEPTTGLHTDDVKRLIEVLERIVDNGDTVVVIEHNLDVIKCADYIIDLGPEGGDQGGTVVATGTPEQISKVKESWTGQYLLKALEWTREHQEGKK